MRRFPELSILAFSPPVPPLEVLNANAVLPPLDLAEIVKSPEILSYAIIPALSVGSEKVPLERILNCPP